MARAALNEFHFARVNQAYAYLRLQKGRIGHLEGPAFWQAYDQAIFNDYVECVPHLPEICTSILDVGGGMGGIDALLVKHYAGRQAVPPDVTILDGVRDGPRMSLHRKTFNNIYITERFLRANGVEKFSWVSPADAGIASAFPVKPDLVVSFGAWCFHFEPETYLQFVIESMVPGARLIIDLRRDKHEWLKTLTQAFEPGAIVRSSAKYERRVFHAGVDR